MSTNTTKAKELSLSEILASCIIPTRVGHGAQQPKHAEYVKITKRSNGDGWNLWLDPDSYCTLNKNSYDMKNVIDVGLLMEPKNNILVIQRRTGAIKELPRKVSANHVVSIGIVAEHLVIRPGTYTRKISENAIIIYLNENLSETGRE